MLDYAAVIERIRAGVCSVKGDLAGEMVTDEACFWLAADRGEPCLAFDSLDLLELLVFLEEEFGWSIPEEQLDAAGWRTVGDLAALVMRNVPEEHDAVRV
jgi:acyl carrier protein